MRFSEYNERVIARLYESVAAFASGDLRLDQVQSALSSACSLLENDGTRAGDMIRLAEADIEAIRFARLLDEQRAAATARLDRLVKELSQDGSQVT